jgi:hypothetical protein
MAKTGMPDGDAARDFFLTKLPDLVEKHTAAPLDAGPAWKVARVFAGHNFEHFDYPLVYCWGQRNGINVHAVLQAAGFIGTVDTLKLCRLIDWGPADPPRDEINRVSHGLGACFAHPTCTGAPMVVKHRAKADALANCSVLGIVALVRYILEHLEHVVVSLGQSTVRVRTLKFVYEKKSPPQQLAVRIAATIDIIAERAQAGSCWDMLADWGRPRRRTARRGNSATRRRRRLARRRSPSARAALATCG